MSNNKKTAEKKGIKSVAETTATTATIVMSGKTIASVIDSGVEVIREYGRADATDTDSIDMELPLAEPVATMTDEEDMPIINNLENNVHTDDVAPQYGSVQHVEEVEPIQEEDISQEEDLAEGIFEERKEDIQVLYSEALDEPLEECITEVTEDEGETNTDIVTECSVNDEGEMYQEEDYTDIIDTGISSNEFDIA